MGKQNQSSNLSGFEHAIGAAAPAVGMLDERSLDFLDGNAMRVISALIGNPSTTRQVALRLGMRMATIQHIIDHLVGNGTATLYRERNDEHTAERYYTIASPDVVLRIASSASPVSQLAGVEVIVDALRKDFTRLVCGDSPGDANESMLEMVKCRMSAAQAQRFLTKLRALTQEFNDAEDPSVDAVFSLAIGFYPSVEQSGDRRAQ
jgi:hypothetical protein